MSPRAEGTRPPTGESEVFAMLWPVESLQISASAASEIEGWSRSVRAVQSFLRSPKRRRIVQRLGFLERQMFEVRTDLYVAKRELAVLNALDDVEDLARDWGEQPMRVARAYLRLLGSARAILREKVPPRLRRSYPEAAASRDLSEGDVILIPRTGISLATDIRVPRSRTRKIRARVSDWLLASDDPWRAMAALSHPFDTVIPQLLRAGRTRQPDEAFAMLLHRSQGHRAGLAADLVRYQKHEALLQDEHAGLIARLDMAIQFAIQPLDDAVQAGSGTKYSIAELLCLIQRRELSLGLALGRLAPLAPNDFWSDFEESGPPEGLLVGSSVLWEVWWVIVVSLLRKSGGIQPDGDMAPWVRDLLRTLILHPAKLARLDVPRDAIAARTMLARRVGELARNSGNLDQREYLELFEDAEGGDLLVMTARLLCGRAVRRDQPTFRSAACARLMKSLFDEILVSGSSMLLGAIRRGLQTRDIDAELTFLSEEEEAAAALLEEAAEEAAERRRARLPDLPPPPPRVSWSYVRHLQDPDDSGTRLGIARPSQVAAFADFFRAEGIEPLVKVQSIVRALAYVESMPDEVRRLLPAERPGDITWAKLKRGRLRILVRFLNPSEACFHIYQRRDWLGPMELA